MKVKTSVKAGSGDVGYDDGKLKFSFGAGAALGVLAHRRVLAVVGSAPM